MLASVIGMKAQEAYVVLSQDSTTLTFYCNDNRELINEETTWNIEDGDEWYPAWHSVGGYVEKVIFDSSFVNARPNKLKFWFARFRKLTTIDGIHNLNTSNVTDMGGMFRECFSLKSLDVSHFNTKKLTGMSYTFSGCSSLTSLDVSNFDTQNFTSMYETFSGCSSLTSLDVSHFDTKNVRDMQGLFSGCSSLTSLDVSHFDTRNVWTMDFMFQDCSSLTSLDLSNFDTSNVTDMDEMFKNCVSLTSLDLSNFDLSKLENSQYMLKDCKGLSSLIIPATMMNADERACIGIGTETNPCMIYVPDGFDFEADTSGDWFVWKEGYFKLGEILAEKINVTTDLGYMTYCSDKTLDFTNVEGMKAYIVVGYDGKVAKLSRIGIAPAETGLLLKAGAGEYEVPYTEEDNYVMNMLIGVLEETTLAPTEGNMTNLVLANGNNGLGFYRLKGSGTLAAHRAYLQVPTRLIATGAKYIKMEFDDETTAIDGVTMQEETSTYYDMQGVRHEGKPSKQGVYIMNGKKIVVK